MTTTRRDGVLILWSFCLVREHIAAVIAHCQAECQRGIEVTDPGIDQIDLVGEEIFLCRQPFAQGNGTRQIAAAGQGGTLLVQRHALLQKGEVLYSGLPFCLRIRHL